MCKIENFYLSYVTVSVVLILFIPFLFCGCDDILCIMTFVSVLSVCSTLLLTIISMCLVCTDLHHRRNKKIFCKHISCKNNKTFVLWSVNFNMHTQKILSSKKIQVVVKSWQFILWFDIIDTFPRTKSKASGKHNYVLRNKCKKFYILMYSLITTFIVRYISIM